MSTQLLTLDENYNNEGKSIVVFADTELLENLENLKDTLSELGGKYKSSLVYFGNSDDLREGYIFSRKKLSTIKEFVEEINNANEEEEENEEDYSDLANDIEKELLEQEEEVEEEKEVEEKEEKVEKTEKKEKKDDAEEKMERILKLLRLGKISFDPENESRKDLHKKIITFYDDISFDFLKLMIYEDSPYMEKIFKAISKAKIRKEKKSQQEFQKNLEKRKRQAEASDRITILSRIADIKIRMQQQKFVLQKEANEFFKYQKDAKKRQRQQYVRDIRPVREISTSEEMKNKISNIKARIELQKSEMSAEEYLKKNAVSEEMREEMQKFIKSPYKPVTEEENKFLNNYEQKQRMYTEELEKFYVHLTLEEVQREITSIENLIKFDKELTKQQEVFYEKFKQNQKKAEYNSSKKFPMEADEEEKEKDLSYFSEEIEKGKKEKKDKTPVKFKINKDELENYKKFGFYLSGNFLSSFLSCNKETTMKLLERYDFLKKLSSVLKNPTEYNEFISYLHTTEEYISMMKTNENLYKFLKYNEIINEKGNKEKLSNFLNQNKNFNIKINEISFITGVPVSIIENSYEQNKEDIDSIVELYNLKDSNNSKKLLNSLKSLRRKLCSPYNKNEIETSKISKFDIILRNIIYSKWYRDILSKHRISSYDFEFLCDYGSLLVSEEKKYREIQDRLKVTKVTKEKEENDEESEEEKEESEESEEELDDEIDEEEFKEEAKNEEEKEYILPEREDWDVKIGKVQRIVKIKQGDNTYAETIETVDGPIYVLNEYQTTYLGGIKSDEKENKKKSIYDIMKEVFVPSKKDIIMIRDKKLNTLKTHIDFFKWFILQDPLPSEDVIEKQLRFRKIEPSSFYEFTRLRNEDKIFIANSLVDQYEQEEKKSTTTYKNISEILSEDELEIYNKPSGDLTPEERDMRIAIEDRVLEDRKSVQNFLRIDVMGDIRDIYLRTKPSKKFEANIYKKIDQEESEKFAERGEDEEEEGDEDDEEEEEEKKEISKDIDVVLARQLFDEFSNIYLTRVKKSYVFYDDLIKKFNTWLLRSYPTQPGIKIPLSVIIDKLGDSEDILKKIGSRTFKTTGFINWRYEEKKEVRESYETFQQFSESAKLYDAKNTKYINFNRSAANLTDEKELDILVDRFNEDEPYISKEFYNGYKIIWQKFNRDDVYKKINLTRYTKMYLLSKTKLLKNPLVMNPFKRNRRLRLLKEKNSQEQRYISRLPKTISDSTKECMIWTLVKPWLNRTFDYILIGDAFGNKGKDLGEGRKLFGQFDSTITQNGKTIYLYRPTKYYHYLMCSLNTSNMFPECYTHDKDYLTIQVDSMDIGIYTVLVNNLMEITESDDKKFYEKKKKYYVLSSKDYENECNWWRTKQNTKTVVLYNIKNGVINPQEEFYIKLRKYCKDQLQKNILSFYLNYIEKEVIKKEFKEREKIINQSNIDSDVITIDEGYKKYIIEKVEFDYFFNKYNNIQLANEEMKKEKSDEVKRQLSEKIDDALKAELKKMKEDQVRLKNQDYRKKKLQELSYEMETVKITKEKYFTKFAEIIIDLIFNSNPQLTYGAIIRKYITFTIAYSDLLRNVAKQYKSFFYIDPVRINKQFFIKIFNLKPEEAYPEIYLHPDGMTRSLLINFFNKLVNDEVDRVIVDVYNIANPQHPMIEQSLKDETSLRELQKRASDIITNCKSLANNFSKEFNKFIWKDLKTNEIKFFDIPTDRFFITLDDFITFLNSNLARYNLAFKQTEGKLTVINKSFNSIRLLSNEEALGKGYIEYTLTNEDDEKNKIEQMEREKGLCSACGLVHINPKIDVTKEIINDDYKSCFNAIKEESTKVPDNERSRFIQQKKSILSRYQTEFSKIQKLADKEVTQRKITVSLRNPAMEALGFTGDYSDTIIGKDESFTAESSPSLFQKGDDLLTKYIISVPSERLISVSTMNGDIVCIDMLELYKEKLERVKNKEPLEVTYLIKLEYLDDPIEISPGVVDVISEVIQSTLFPTKPLILSHEEPLSVICQHCKSELKNDEKTFQTFEQVIHEDIIETNFLEFCSSKCFEKYKEKGEEQFEEVHKEFSEQFDIETDNTSGNYRMLKNFLNVMITDEMFISPEDKQEYIEKYYPEKDNFSIENLIDNIKKYKINIGNLLAYISDTYIINNKKVIQQVLPIFDVKDGVYSNKEIIERFQQILTSFDPEYADELMPNISADDIKEESLESLEKISEKAISQHLNYSDEEFENMFTQYLRLFIQERDTDKYERKLQQRTSVSIDFPNLDIYIDKIKQKLNETDRLTDEMLRIIQQSNSQNFESVESFTDLLSDVFSEKLTDNKEEIQRSFNLLKTLNQVEKLDEQQEEKNEKVVLQKPITEFAFDSKRHEYIKKLLKEYFKIEERYLDKIHKNVFIDINNIYDNDSFTFALDNLIDELDYMRILKLKNNSFANDLINNFCKMVKQIIGENILQYRLSISSKDLENLIQYISYCKKSNKLQDFEKYKKIIADVLRLNFQIEEAMLKKQHETLNNLLKQLENYKKELIENVELQNLNNFSDHCKLSDIEDLSNQLYSFDMKSLCNVIIEIVDKDRIVVEHEKLLYSILDNKEFVTKSLDLSSEGQKILKTLVFQDDVFLNPVVLLHKIEQILYSGRVEKNLSNELEKILDELDDLISNMVESYKNNNEPLNNVLKKECESFRKPARFDLYFYKDFLKQDLVYRNGKKDLLKQLIKKYFKIKIPHVVDYLAKLLYSQTEYISEKNFFASYFDFIKKGETFLVENEDSEIKNNLYQQYKELVTPFIIDNIFLKFFKSDRNTLNSILCNYKELKSSGKFNDEEKEQYEIFFKILEFYKLWKNSNKEERVVLAKKQDEILDNQPPFELSEYCYDKGISEESSYQVKKEVYYNLYKFLDLPDKIDFELEGDFIVSLKNSSIEPIELEPEMNKINNDIIVKKTPDEVLAFTDEKDYILTKNSEYFKTQLAPPSYREFFDKDLTNFDFVLKDDFPETAYKGPNGKLTPVLPNDTQTSTLDYKLDIPNHWGQRKLLLTEIDFFTKYLDPDNEDVVDVIYAGAAHGTHISLLFRLFPNLRFHLYDPAIFDSSLKKYVDEGKIIINEYYHDMKYKRININKKTPFLPYRQRQRLPEDYGFFTNEVAEYYKKKFFDEKLNYSKCMFISDIRRDLPKDKFKTNTEWWNAFEKIAMEDQEFMKQWVLIMRPQYSMLKFKQPYVTEDKPVYYKYLKGEIHLQTWSPPNSAETRLLITHEDLDTEVYYNIISYERKTSYYNYLRTQNIDSYIMPYIDMSVYDFGKEVAPKIKKYTDNFKYYTLDFYTEFNIMYNYFLKFDKPSKWDSEKFIRHARYVTSVIDRTKNDDSDAFILKLKEADE